SFTIGQVKRIKLYWIFLGIGKVITVDQLTQSLVAASDINRYTMSTLSIKRTQDMVDRHAFSTTRSAAYEHPHIGGDAFFSWCVKEVRVDRLSMDSVTKANAGF